MSQVARPNTAYLALLNLQSSPILGDSLEYEREARARRERIDAIKYVIATGEIYDRKKAKTLRERHPEITNIGGAPSGFEPGAFPLLGYGQAASD